MANILIIEDDELIRSATTEFVGRLGYTTFSVGSAEEADDVLKDTGWVKNGVTYSKTSSYRNRSNLTLAESAIVEILDSSGCALHIDVLGERSGVGIQELLVDLLDLEFRDVVRQLPGKYFSTVF